MADRSHYEVLGVAAGATFTEVRAAYRRAARDSHPDAGGDVTQMSELNAAWQTLRDPHRRAAYDRQLARRPATPGTTPTARRFEGVDDEGAWDAEAGRYRSADEWADLADARPIGQTRVLEGWWAMLPPATLLATFVMVFASFMFRAPSFLALAGGLLVLSLGLFVLAPLRAMSRRDQD